MKLSTRGRYGVKAMVDLAVHSSDEYVSLKSIAQRQNISENYLEQLFAVLKKAGLIKSARGALGGYALALSPEEITIGAVLRALEGSLAPVDCVTDDGAARCERSENCVTKSVWKRIRDNINDVVDSITLGSLIDKYRENKSREDYMFYI